MTDWLDAYMKYTENSEPPDTYKLWTGISVIAACLRRKCVLNWGSLTFYPNMYVVLVGPSGKCRKGTAMKPGMKLLKDIGVPLSSESITREALVRELKESRDDQVDVLTGTPYLHSSLTIYSEELTVFLGYNNQQLMADLCNWYDCGDKWTYRTKNMGTDEIRGVWVNLVGATTPELLQTTLPRDAIGGGLTSRIIFVYEFKKGKTVLVPFYTDEERELEEKLIRDLGKISLLTGEFKLTEGFVNKWIDWYSVQDQCRGPIFDDYKFSGYVERRPTHAMKLSMILSASRTSDMVVTEGDLERALKILAITEIKMPHTFSGIGRLDMSDIVHRIMVFVSQVKKITYSDLLRTFYQDVDRIGLDKMVDTMEAMHFIKRTMLPGGEVEIEYIDQKGIMK